MRGFVALSLAMFGTAVPAQSAPVPAQSVKAARCSIWMRNAIQYDGPCQFEAERGGSFSLSFPYASGDLSGLGIGEIFVLITARGVAVVSDSGPDGHVSNWGPARRSRRDRACWEGRDFRVCAY
ncbi:hypothetical protein OF829_07775 [Sphingomonas sp. LB-2]|nr:hypothetical protein [Sphingomonas caeni]